jgi:hypothetical protein
MYHYTDGGLRNIWLANGYECMETSYVLLTTQSALESILSVDPERDGLKR